MKPINVEPYNPAWSQTAFDEITKLRSVVSPPLVDIEHIGSTAVPGLASKPIIDLMASVPQLSDVQGAQQRLSDFGYSLVETGMPERLFFQRFDWPQAFDAHLHIVTVSSWPTRKERLFRDALLASSDQVAEYGALKTRLAAEFRDDRDGYTRAKTAFIQKVMDEVHDRLGIPRTDVWET